MKVIMSTSFQEALTKEKKKTNPNMEGAALIILAIYKVLKVYQV